MLFSKLKISAKLFISSAVFLVPVLIMLFLIYTSTMGAIRKNRNEQDGVRAIRPAAALFQKAPRYMSITLGLEPGDALRASGDMEASLKELEDALKRYDAAEQTIREDWEALKNSQKGSDGHYAAYSAFIKSLRSVVSLIGEKSTLILASDMGNYYYINTALRGMPESAVRLSSFQTLLWKAYLNSDAYAERYNTELKEAQAQGRRLSRQPFTGTAQELLVSMLPSDDWSFIRNNTSLIESDREEILGSLEQAQKITQQDAEIREREDDYSKASSVLADQCSRLLTFNNPNPTRVAEMITGVGNVNESACRLWTSALERLDALIAGNIADSRGRMAMYLVIALVAVLLAFAVVLLSTMDINKSVKSLRMLFRSLDEKDLTLALDVNSQDEFGELMTAFNGFLDILRSTFGSFKESTQVMANSVFDLSSSAKEITTTANQQSASSSEIVSTMENLKNLSAQIAAKTGEVASLAGQTQELSAKGADLRNANQEMMEDIRSQNLKIISEIRNLNDMIGRIIEAIRIIDGIADQTKLIAFNASLEASSSGESGARFSVVAAEIRRFADNVVESTREIKQKIEEVQGASQTLITEANNGSKQIELGYERMSEQKIVFEQIVENSQNVATRSQQISNLSRQQELASSQVFTALKEISAGVKQFVTATASTSKIADSLNGMSEDLKVRVDKFRTS